MWPRRKQLIAEIEKRSNSRLISLITSDRPGLVAQMARDVLPLMFNHLRGLDKNSTGRIDVPIFTTGGDTLTGFALARLIREFVESVRALVPGACDSAGTVFALGANQIYIWRDLERLAPSTRQLRPLSIL
jgi:ATP-dependent protease ClpP protease subunit